MSGGLKIASRAPAMWRKGCGYVAVVAFQGFVHGRDHAETMVRKILDAVHVAYTIRKEQKEVNIAKHCSLLNNSTESGFTSRRNYGRERRHRGRSVD